jgi:hypothetical protein
MQKLLPILALVLIWSCKPAVTDTATETDTAAVQTPASGEVPFTGHWLDETYYQSIITDKSPRAAQELVKECFIYIPPGIKERARMGYNWHEIGPEMELVLENGTYTYWGVQNDTLVEQAFTITQVDPTHLMIGDKRFVKVDISEMHTAPLVLEAILFSGTYKTSDGKTVTFTPDAKVSGMENFSQYHVRADYMDMGLQIDQVGFKSEGTKPVYYGFKYKGNTLELYEIRCTAFDKTTGQCAEAAFGKLKHTLTKQ